MGVFLICATFTGPFVPAESTYLKPMSPTAAAFNLVMLATTGGGDSYPFSELDQMFRNAGFDRTELHDLPPPQSG